METYWKVNEVAAAIQVSEQTIYRYMANGEIPFHKLNRAVRFGLHPIKFTRLSDFP
jgi:excisionase family DNA binding protein